MEGCSETPGEAVALETRPRSTLRSGDGRRVCYGGGGEAQSDGAVAATIRHETCHKEIFLSHPENVANFQTPDGDIIVHFDDENPDDEDGDGVWNVDEMSGRWGIASNEKNADTYNMGDIDRSYREYGDEEIRARLAERQNLESAYHADRDWCNPGCQSEVRRGPMKDDK